MIGVVLGSFSVQQVTEDKRIPPDEMTLVEVETIEVAWDESDFAALWRNVHGSSATRSDETFSESGSTLPGSGSGGIWRLVGVVAISGEKMAFLMSPENMVVVVKEGQEFGGNHHVTEIRTKSVSYRDPENESYVLSLYRERREVEL